MGPTATEVIHDQEPGEIDLLVDFEYPNDPRIPQNWSMLKKVYVISILSLFNVIGTIASSVMGPAQSEVAQYFNVSDEVAVLCTTLFLVVSLHNATYHKYRK